MTYLQKVEKAESIFVEFTLHDRSRWFKITKKEARYQKNFIKENSKNTKIEFFRGSLYIESK